MSREGKRALARDVFLYDLRDLHTLLGGLVLNRGVTNANLYALVNIVCVISSPFFLQNDHGDTIPEDAQSLLPGNYFIVADGIVQMNDELVYTRDQSFQTGTRVQAFTDQVRERDGRCVVTKLQSPGPVFGIWDGFEAAHIFPLAYEQQWQENNYSRWITLLPSRGGAINSVQNGLLLRGDLHQLFDRYYFAIDPDDGYKVISFQPDFINISGTRLDARLLDDPRRPLDQLLRWHFLQAVLTNMRGAGEPYFEHDFPPGSDIMADIREGPNAARRMEFELFDRLAHHTDITEMLPEEECTSKEERDGQVSDQG